MPDLYTCAKCKAKFAKLAKLRCNVCNHYTCPSCSSCYCDFSTEQGNKGRSNVKLSNISSKEKNEPPLFVSIEYAKFLVLKNNLQLKGHLEYIGQRNIVSKDKSFIISDFLFYDKNDHIPLRIFGPVPQNIFKYRFAINKVLLKKVKIQLFKGEFELFLEREGEIVLLKDKQNQPLLKFFSEDSSQNMEPSKAES